MPDVDDWPMILGKMFFGGVQHPHNRLDVERVAAILASVSSAEFMLSNFPKALNCYHNRRLLVEASQYSNIPGLVLEFGVHTGNTITLIANTFNQDVFGFDSFDGLPEDWTTTQRAGRYSTQGKPPDNLPGNVHLRIGLFQETLDKFLLETAGDLKFVHIDSDLYSSARFVLQTIRSRIVPGTIIVFNDFFNYPGWQNGEARAWREFSEYYGVTFRYIGWASRESGVAILVEKT